MPKAYSYIRFSSAEQARGDSLRRQVAKAEKWCAERGLVLDETLRDEGVSAYRGSNAEVGSALGSFLHLVKSAKIERGSLLLVESLDRLSRENVNVALPRFLDLINAGIVIVTMEDGQEYSSARIERDFSPLIVSLCAMARAHEESRTKSFRVGEAWGKKRQAAREDGKPIGHRCPSWLRLMNGRYEVIPERAEIVRQIFSLAVAGYGQRAIVARLNLDGVPVFRGSKKSQRPSPSGWQTSTVRRVLTSPTVLGEYQPHTGSHRAGSWKPEGDPIKAYYPAVIDEDVFWRAQRALEGRRVSDGSRGRGGRRGKGIAHLLLGLGRCSRCRGAMHLLNKGPAPKGGLYLACSTSMRKAGCENDVRWRVEDLEARLLRGLSYLDAQSILTGDPGHSTGGQIETLRSRLADAERRRDRLLAIVESGDDAATARFKSVVDEIKAIRKDLSAAEKEAAKAAADPGIQTRLADAIDLSAKMDEADGEQRTAIRVRLAEQLRNLVHEIRCDPELGALAILSPQPNVSPQEVPWIVGAGQAQRWRLWLDGDPQGMEAEDEWDSGPEPVTVFGKRLTQQPSAMPAPTPTREVNADIPNSSPRQSLLRPLRRNGRTPARS
ncbi:recombinase family protein [Bosea sp. RCC_152_1]|uniref:recombinase family protein n=1 Tax=Bosea sp. RCC_152_1 TaxID=3239228 RepID=UPI003525A540